MAIQYDRANRVRYCDIHNLDLVNGEKICCDNDTERYWHNPDGTSNDIP